MFYNWKITPDVTNAAILVGASEQYSILWSFKYGWINLVEYVLPEPPQPLTKFYLQLV